MLHVPAIIVSCEGFNIPQPMLQASTSNIPAAIGNPAGKSHKIAASSLTHAHSVVLLTRGGRAS